MTSDISILTSVLQGFGLGFSLILAIGAQNAFVLRQGIRRAHVAPIVLTCALSDAVLIILGVTSFGVVSDLLPWLVPVLRYGGAAFLFAYGARAFWSAWQGGAALEAAQSEKGSLRAAILTCLALTWANPHVYLDTVGLLGSVSTQFAPYSGWFGFGAVVSSFVFFTALGFGARALAPVFAKPVAWRILDVVVGVVMWTLALGLLRMG